jgi:hypothetical protein
MSVRRHARVLFNSVHGGSGDGWLFGARVGVRRGSGDQGGISRAYLCVVSIWGSDKAAPASPLYVQPVGCR